MKLTLLPILICLLPGFAHAADPIINLPEGQIELADIMTPAEIYADMLQQNPNAELGLNELDASINEATQARIYIYVSKAKQHLYVYQNGSLVPGWDWPVSTGTEQMRCPPHAGCRIAHTPTGIRHPGVLDWEHYSSLYDNAPMHRAIQFIGGVFLHATYGSHIRMLGRRDSGGCIRQYPPNAEKLFLLVRETIASYSRKAVLIEVTER